MNNELKITTTLLKVIKEDANIKKLKHLRLSYAEIAVLIDNNITNGNLFERDGEVLLTDQGSKFLAENQYLIKETDKSKWIEPDFKNKIKKIGKDDVFLPSKNELSFLKKLP